MPEFLIRVEAEHERASDALPLLHHELAARGARRVVCGASSNGSVVAAFRWDADDAATAQREAAKILREALAAVTGADDATVQARPLSLVG